jgi:DNA-directed RNA polymerase specialized sigma24 family protein
MPGPPPEDRDLLKRIAAGDDAAFAAFYRTHLDAVTAFFRRRVPEAELAFDLAAERFAAVVAGAASYGGAGPAAE